jgi:hypothetical protein
MPSIRVKPKRIAVKSPWLSKPSHDVGAHFTITSIPQQPPFLQSFFNFS